MQIRSRIPAKQLPLVVTTVAWPHGLAPPPRSGGNLNSQLSPRNTAIYTFFQKYSSVCLLSRWGSPRIFTCGSTAGAKTKLAASTTVKRKTKLPGVTVRSAVAHSCNKCYTLAVHYLIDGEAASSALTELFDLVDVLNLRSGLSTDNRFFIRKFSPNAGT